MPFQLSEIKVFTQHRDIWVYHWYLTMFLSGWQDLILLRHTVPRLTNLGTLVSHEYYTSS